MKKFIATFLTTSHALTFSILATLNPATSLATLCITSSGDINSGFEYFRAINDALVQAKSGRDELQSIRGHQNEPDFATTFMTALKTSQQFYQCGISIVKRYESSNNEMISGGARKMNESIAGLMKGNDYHLKEVRMLLSGNSKMDPAQKADQDSDNQVAVDDAWKNLGISAITATWAVMEDPKSSKKLSITANQKEQLIESLERNFGKKMRSKEDRVVEVIANQLLKFLRQKWQLANSKQ